MEVINERERGNLPGFFSYLSQRGNKEREKSVQAAVGLLNILALANMLLKNSFC